MHPTSIRDSVLCQRIQTELDARGAGRVTLAEPPLPTSAEDSAFAARLAESGGILVLLSREGSVAAGVRLAVRLARAGSIPTGLVVYPGVVAPGWAPVEATRIDLTGFNDNGPALPPGTDEGQFFRRSRFVEVSLMEIVAFLSGLRRGPGPAGGEIAA